MNFRKIQKKIKTVDNVKKITKAMQMVSAVKMKKSQQAALDSKYYTATLETMLGKIIDSYDIDKSKILWSSLNQPTKKYLYIVISSNKGLCGSFNFNLFKLILKEANFDQSIFVTVGKKAFSFINHAGGSVNADFSSKSPFINNASAIFQIAKSLYFNSDKVEKVYLVYNQFFSTFIYKPIIDQLIPLMNLSEFTDEKSQLIKSNTDYLIEPLNLSLINTIIEDLLVQKIRKAIMDSEASEYSSRMIAMKNATDNAQDLIDNLTLIRNKLRQASITNELLEMTAAAQSTASAN